MVNRESIGYNRESVAVKKGEKNVSSDGKLTHTQSHRIVVHAAPR